MHERDQRDVAEEVSFMITQLLGRYAQKSCATLKNNKKIKSHELNCSFHEQHHVASVRGRTL